MIFSGFEVYRYNLPLIIPIKINNILLTHRQGLVLRLWDENGNMGYGEAAPLPGLHRENLQDIESELQEIGKNLPGSMIPQDLSRLKGQFKRWLGKYSLSASTCTGLELAILNLLAASRQLKLVELFGKPVRTEIKLNGLIMYGGEDLARQTKILVESGYQTVKLKVGLGDIGNDVKRVNKVRQALGSKARIRLDANQAWDLAEAVSFVRSIGSQQVEYIEEPLRDPTKLSRFYRETEMPVALDESLLSMESLPVSWPRGVKALVLKPALLGGIEKAVQLIRSTQQEGLYTVLSSIFESGISLSALAQLAAVFCPSDIAMGLDTWRWMGEDLLLKPFRPRQGRIIVSEIVTHGGNINMQKLETVFHTG